MSGKLNPLLLDHNLHPLLTTNGQLQCFSPKLSFSQLALLSHHRTCHQFPKLVFSTDHCFLHAVKGMGAVVLVCVCFVSVLPLCFCGLFLFNARRIVVLP